VLIKFIKQSGAKNHANWFVLCEDVNSQTQWLYFWATLCSEEYILEIFRTARLPYCDDVFSCMSATLSVHSKLSKATCANFKKFLYALIVAMAWSSSDNNATRHVDPTSSFVDRRRHVCP